MNPDEWVPKNLKKDQVGRVGVAEPDDLKAKAVAALRRLQRLPRVVQASCSNAASSTSSSRSGEGAEACARVALEQMTARFFPCRRTAFQLLAHQPAAEPAARVFLGTVDERLARRPVEPARRVVSADAGRPCEWTGMARRSTRPHSSQRPPDARPALVWRPRTGSSRRQAKPPSRSRGTPRGNVDCLSCP